MAIEVLNKITAVPEETPVINVSMTNPIYRGPQGVQGPQGLKGDKGEQGIQGPIGEKGDTGNSGVYVGADEPTDESVVVWIDIDGGANLTPAEGGSY